MNIDECLFCKFATGAIPVEKIYSNDSVFAINDINPQSPTHVLIIPVAHDTDAAAVSANQPGVMDALFSAAAQIAAEITQLLGTKHHDDDQQHDQPMPNRKRTHVELLNYLSQF
jgi:diadenosine tetraphosphate (Ap4A) HIT family hydrolase